MQRAMLTHRAQELEAQIKIARIDRVKQSNVWKKLPGPSKYTGQNFQTGSDVGTLDALRATAKQAGKP